MHIEWWTPRGLDAHREAETLAELRKEPAYVVVGGGAAAQMRAEAATAGAEPISCRDFICFHQTRAQDWKKQPALFLEGFGELRTPIDTLGQQWPEDMRAPLDRLRGALDGLRPKKLRIHTTASRWLGGNDARHLATRARAEESPWRTKPARAPRRDSRAGRKYVASRSRTHCRSEARPCASRSARSTC